jgi:hypothetical protein
MVYKDSVIAVALFAEDSNADKRDLLHLGVRWLKPLMKNRTGKTVLGTNVMGGETGWFLLPHSFGASVGRTLIDQKVSDCGLADSFNSKGFKRLVKWLVEMEELDDAMCY